MRKNVKSDLRLMRSGKKAMRDQQSAEEDAPGAVELGRATLHRASGESSGSRNGRYRSLQEGKSMFLAMPRCILETIQRDTRFATAA